MHELLETFLKYKHTLTPSVAETFSAMTLISSDSNTLVPLSNVGF